MEIQAKKNARLYKERDERNMQIVHTTFIFEEKLDTSLDFFLYEANGLM